MERVDFKEFYNKVIDEYIRELFEIDASRGYNCLRLRKFRIQRIYNYYEIKRLAVRKHFMKLQNQPMDRHKIAAVMMQSILKAKLIKVDKTVPGLPNILLMANEYLAFYTALNIVEMYRNDDNETSVEVAQKNGTVPQLKEVPIRIPPVYHGVDREKPSSYISSVCKSLYLLKSLRSFDVFAYANIFFLLERYTDDICEKEQEIEILKNH